MLLLKLCAALRTHDLCVDAPTLSLTQRQIFTFTWDVGIRATGTGDKYHGATSSVPPDSIGKVADLRGRQAIQLTEGRQVLDHCFLTAGLTGDHAPAGLVQDQRGQLRVFDPRGVEGLCDGDGQFTQVWGLPLKRL